MQDSATRPVGDAIPPSLGEQSPAYEQQIEKTLPFLLMTRDQGQVVRGNLPPSDPNHGGQTLLLSYYSMNSQDPRSRGEWRLDIGLDTQSPWTAFISTAVGGTLSALRIKQEGQVTDADLDQGQEVANLLTLIVNDYTAHEQSQVERTSRTRSAILRWGKRVLGLAGAGR